MLKKVVSIIYIVAFAICVICLQIFAIMAIFKLSNATSLAWINCCVPLIIAILIAPLILITKNLIDK